MKNIPLINTSHVAIIDDEDYTLVTRFNWWLADCDGHLYAYTSCWGSKFSMHCLLMLFPLFPLVVRHIDDIGLHNFRSNLKVATQSENLQNATQRMGRKSIFPRGVFENKAYKNGVSRYTARIAIKRKFRNLGTYDTPQEASLVYEKVRETLFGNYNGA